MSAATNAASINGTNTSSSSQSFNASGTKAQLKMSSSGKALDGSRKQAGSPIDNAQRKSTPKAWTGNNNAITQRPSNMSTSNGVVSNTKSLAAPKTAALQPTESNSIIAEKHAADRMLFLLAGFVGHHSFFTLKNGDKYSGIFSGASLETSESRYVFKMVKRVQQANGSPEPIDEYIGTGGDHVMSVDIVDVVDLDVQQVKLDRIQPRQQNGISSFQTDSDISGNLAIKERELKPWQPADNAGPGLSLEDSGKPWDQFEANERLYGIKSTFNENDYTTAIDKSNPLYKQRFANAERIARELEGSAATSAHVAEERGLTTHDDSGLDEEDKYSGVRRDFPSLASGQPNKYTPPARRAPTGQPTVPGAPVDPAIISASIARPPSTTTSPTKADEVTPQLPVPATDKPAETLKQAVTAVPSAGVANASTSQDPKISPPQASEASQKPSATLKPTAPVTAQTNKSTARVENATANVENELLKSFKQFSSNEKFRIQEQQRSMARADKAVKLNDLKKFSEMFKLHTPVPQDLVPILAKDESKQQEIVEKALKNVNEAKTTPTKPATATTLDTKTPRATQNVTSPVAQPDKSNGSRQQRQGPGNYPTSSMRGSHHQNVPRSGGGPMGQRSSVTGQQYKAGTIHMPASQPQPINNIHIPSGPSATSSGIQTPSSGVSTRFNVKAMEFKPNPAASTFTPGGNPSNTSSPRVTTPARPDSSRKVVLTSFFGGQKPKLPSDSSVLDTAFNPIERMRKEAEAEKKTKDYVLNGGIPQAFRTGPLWEVRPENAEKKYVDCFQVMQTAAQPIVTHGQMGGPHVPHQHQLPHHLQQQIPNMPQHHTPHHTPRHPHAQPHHAQGMPHFEGGHPMQFSASQSSMHPTSRPGQNYGGYGPQMQQGMPPAAVFQQSMPGYGMSPNIHHRQPGGPQFVHQMPVMGGHVMTQNPSQGPYMVPGNPQVQMYTPLPGQAYPHHGGPMPMQPAPNGFSSPRAHGAQMMAHQGSQQGHQPQPQIMYMQPGQHQMMQMPQGPSMNYRHYANKRQANKPVVNTPQRHFQQLPQMHFGSPHQSHPYPQQPHRGTPSATYSQPMMPTQSLPPHTGPSPHATNGEEAK
ncbi:hypothetical protein EJ05DRAFT_484405 [Pseudovirgaria hyperparasitica]|uniref:LsmAD domain-containing protein n=1 Tax=Pseudovirgaria hyperparasitica TaxID=470096 RepID=A0A6A6W9C2_9PEZI|nr:uncharacterized protein EJ05DRAFT_484405 [Pseudovirgaria hyperparasitica]KAF2759452.1 hypothetical protein EJ05DRAFT_484405 [Pseudovirgaria hyperparasitica]